MEKVDKKDHILNIAEKVFAELGYEGASTRILAKEAGVNMAMLNYYFGSKDGLLRAVLERRVASMGTALADVKNKKVSSWEKLAEAVDMYLDRVLSNNCFQKLIHRELSLTKRTEMGEYVTDAILINLTTFSNIIKEGISNGTFRDVDVELTVASIFGTKTYLVNSTRIASKLLKMDIDDPEVIENEIKPRVKKHLHDFLKAHLTKHDIQI